MRRVGDDIDLGHATGTHAVTVRHDHVVAAAAGGSDVEERQPWGGGAGDIRAVEAPLIGQRRGRTAHEDVQIKVIAHGRRVVIRAKNEERFDGEDGTAAVHTVDVARDNRVGAGIGELNIVDLQGGVGRAGNVRAVELPLKGGGRKAGTGGVEGDRVA